MKRLWVGVGLALLATLGVAVAATTGAPGLDRSYGDDGIVAVPSYLAEGGWIQVSEFGAARDGAAYVVGRASRCESGDCVVHDSLLRFEPDGARDTSFGGEGAALLPQTNEYPTVVADGAGRAVVGAVRDGTIALRRLTLDGEPDQSFGKEGLVELPCRCGRPELELLDMSGGRLLVVTSRQVVDKAYRSIATEMRLFELLPNGSGAPGFGHAGVVDVRIPQRGDFGTTAQVSGGAILLGGSECCRAPQLWLRRITASGDVDRHFDRLAARSLRRLRPLGDDPSLTSIVSGADGTIAVIGTIGEDGGFDLRLRRDGRLATGFGVRGRVHLPFNVEAAVGGVRGAVFVIGQGRPRGYRAYRVLADGRFDPAYDGARGLEVPLPGEVVEVRSQGGGQALVTGFGYFECSEECPSKPTMARFLE